MDCRCWPTRSQSSSRARKPHPTHRPGSTQPPQIRPLISGGNKGAIPRTLYFADRGNAARLLRRRCSVSYRRPMARAEDKIRGLCSELLAASGDEERRRIVVELRNALHQYIERLRRRYSAYPFLVERRARKRIPPLKREDHTDAAEKTGLRRTGT
jgi:hypothetical protein